MRLSLATAASIALTAALLAGCSSSTQGTSALPGSSSRVEPRGNGPRIPAMIYQEAAGKAAAPVTHGVMQRLLATLESGKRPKLARQGVRHGTKIGLWVADTDYAYLLGFSANGKKTINLVDAETNNCYLPIGLKVDHNKNLWVACQYNYNTFENGIIQEYSAAGVLLNTYNDTSCGTSCGSSYEAGFPDDVAVDSQGNVFAANIETEVVNCNPSCTYTYSPTVVWWPSSGGQPTFITDPNMAATAAMLFLDTDTAGNVYVDGETSQDYPGSPELDEISNPTTSPTISDLIPPGTITYGGGVYVSTHDGAQTLNVTDQVALTTSQYPLPFGALSRVLGPTLTNFKGNGNPISGGFNKTDTDQVIADGYGWLDVGKVNTNKYSVLTNFNILNPEGAAYSPSDK
ncbi:MAG TPA: hypothetical protein VKR56_08635 [Candidatus Cybelea sp.]|nr:hypothetical protein [Candidatus Cybelea sp.]